LFRSSAGCLGNVRKIAAKIAVLVDGSDDLERDPAVSRIAETTAKLRPQMIGEARPIGNRLHLAGFATGRGGHSSCSARQSHLQKGIALRLDRKKALEFGLAELEQLDRLDELRRDLLRLHQPGLRDMAKLHRS